MARNVRQSSAPARAKADRSAAAVSSLSPPGVEEFLGAELGNAFDADGEPLALTARDFAVDRELRQLAWRLWQDHQRRRGTPPRRQLENAGLEPADLWMPGLSESLQSCSTDEELERYRLKLRFRADLLEALMEETLAELERANALEHAPDAPKPAPRTPRTRSRGRRNGASGKAGRDVR